MIQVNLFGAFLVRPQPQTRIALGTNGRRLASYLFSFPNQTHRREKILDQFWGDSDIDQARAALSTALWRLRGLTTIDPESKIRLSTGPQEIRLEIGNPYVVDAHRFRAEVLSGVNSDRRSPNFERFSKAANLYTGPFLAEYDEDWVLEMRERLQSMYLRVLMHLMVWYIQQGRHEDALYCGRRILSSDPSRENVQRAMMLLYVMNGQRAEGVRQFKRYEDVLRRECDVSPMPQTYLLLGLIKSDEIVQKLPKLLDAELAGTIHNLSLCSF